MVNDATSRINALLRSMDAVLLTLDHASVSGVYQQAKSFFCCSLVNQVYTQWAATITVVALAWAAVQCALLVLQRLDTLSGELGCRVLRPLTTHTIVCTFLLQELGLFCTAVL